MSGVQYLQSKRGRYNFRRRYPRRLVLLIGPGEIVRALPPCTYLNAVGLVRRYTTISDKVFQMALKVSDLTKEHFEDLAREQFRNFLDKDESNLGAGVLDGPERWIDISKQTLKENEWRKALAPAKKVLSNRGYELDIDDEALIDFCRMLIRALTESSRIATARSGGDYTARPEDPLFQGADKTTQGPSNARSILLLKACEKFREEKIEDDAWQYSSIRENKNCHNLILEWFGNIPIHKITRIEVSAFLEILRKQPSDRGRSDAMRGQSMREYAALSEANSNLNTLSATTISKYMRNFGALFDWAVRKGYATTNPVRGVYQSPTKRRSKKDDKNAFTADQLKFWFTSPVYMGCKSASRRHTDGHLIIKDSWYWLPLLWLFHPVRPEEMAQLFITDVKEEDGISYFDIDGGASASEVRKSGKKIKTVAARRKMPIHSFLIDVGFIDYLEEQRQAGSHRVFPELKRYGGDQTYSGYLCKRFREAIRKQGMIGLSAYSFRHNAITALANGYENQIVRRYLQAHSLGGEDDRYVKSFKLKELKSAIDSIVHDGIDISFFPQEEN